MAIQVEGAFQVQRSQQEVYDFLTDPEKFAPLLPDFQNLQMQDERHFTVTVKMGISYIRGNATVKMELAEAEPPKRAVYKGKGQMAGGSVDTTAGFQLEGQGNGTLVKWKGVAQISGRLASVAGGLLEPLARKNLEKLVDSLKQALAA